MNGVFATSIGNICIFEGETACRIVLYATFECL